MPGAKGPCDVHLAQVTEAREASTDPITSRVAEKAEC